MAKYYYHKRSSKAFRKILALGIIIAGILISSYVFFPLLSWQIYFAPVFASQNIEVPIPKTTVITGGTFTNLLGNAGRALTTDLTQAGNWYPNFASAQGSQAKTYSISIPKIGLKDAVVTNSNGDLSKQLVQFNTDTIPPHNGNTIIFGHSTLPQLFNPKDDKTIFANLYKLGPSDLIEVKIDNVEYIYRVQSV
ncbi:MAG: sortase, partial [Candidatus Levybacteria bacterium]|nr:sortase [Candidatus Levybacteria bacterium]